MILYRLGAFEERKQEILNALQIFYGGTATADQLNTLYDVLLAEVEVKQYGDTELDVEEGVLSLCQYGEKVYYHDGSDEYRKFIYLRASDAHEYNSRKENPREGDIDWWSRPQGAWLTCSQEHFYTVIPPKPGEWGFSGTVLYVKGLAGIPYAKVKQCY